MTVASIEQPAVPLSAGCSREPLFSGEDQQFFPITTPTSSLSFDWSDFPVLSQYNVEVPPPESSSSPSHHYSSSSPLVSSRRGCSRSCSWPNAPTAELESHDDDATSLSSSEDDDTIVESRCEEERRTVNRDPNKKSVSFAPVLEIRSHSVVLGDHPCCSSLALELGWEYEEAEVVDFDLYENSRCYQRRHSALRLSYWERRRLLEQSTGQSEEELLLQEQLRWREQLGDRAPSPAQKSCFHEAASQCSKASLRKVSSVSILSSLSL